MQDQTVLISGLGIAGPTLAYWLKAAGYHPTIVEVAPALREGGYVVDFWGLGYDIAEHMGLGEEISRTGYHMRELRVVGDQGERLAGFGTDVIRELAGGRFVTIARSDLSRLLFQKIAYSTEVIFGEDITTLDEQAESVRVGFRSGKERAFSLVVGADGLHSAVRRLAFGPQDRFEKRLGYAVAAFETRGYRPRDETIYTLYGQPGRMLGRFALHDDRTLFLFILDTGAGALPDSLPGQKAMLTDRYGRDGWECARILAELDRTDALYFDRVSQIKMQQWSRGRIALVGDAAFCISLLGGQGTALAMTAAYVLAGELARSEGRYQQAFERYQQVLGNAIAAKQRAAQQFASAFAPKTRWGLLVRNLVINLLGIPGLGRLTVGRDLVDRIELPAYNWLHLPPR